MEAAEPLSDPQVIYSQGQTVAALIPVDSENSAEQWCLCAVVSYLPEQKAYDLIDVAESSSSRPPRFVVNWNKALAFPQPDIRTHLNRIIPTGQLVSTSSDARVYGLWFDESISPDDRGDPLATDESRFSSVFYPTYVLAKPSELEPGLQALTVRFAGCAHEEILPFDYCLVPPYSEEVYSRFPLSLRVGQPIPTSKDAADCPTQFERYLRPGLN